MIALLLAGCEPTPTEVKPSDTSAGDTGVDSVETAADSDSAVDSDSPSDTDTDTGDPWPVDTCPVTFEPEADYPPAGACDPTLPWVDVSGGVMQTCAVKSDGCGQCWGALMDTPEYAVPDVRFQMIRMTNRLDTWDEFHVCGLTQDARPLCWGGPNHYDENSVPSGIYTALGTSTNLANGVTADGSIQQWGYIHGCAAGPYTELVTSWYRSGALGPEGTLELFQLVQYRTPVAGTWREIAMGDNWLCGIRTDLDDSLMCVDNSTGEEVALPGLPSGRFMDVCAGDLEGCALDELGVPACWSWDEVWDSLAYPPPGPFVAITCGAAHACGLTAEGTLECWGDNFYGETTPPS